MSDALRVKEWYNKNAEHKIQYVMDWRELNLAHRQAWERKYKKRKRLGKRPQCQYLNCTNKARRKWCSEHAAIVRADRPRTQVSRPVQERKVDKRGVPAMWTTGDFPPVATGEIAGFRANSEWGS